MTNRAKSFNLHANEMPPARDTTISRFRNSDYVRAFLLLLASLVVYFPARHGEFLWDDNVMLTQNPFVKSPDGLGVIWFSTRLTDYLPLTSSSFWLEWKFWGMNPTGYHLTNILLHGLGAVLLWRVFRRLKISGAWIAALVFALHPVCIGSVAWITERKNTLSFVFFAASVLGFLRSQENRLGEIKWRWYGLSLFMFVFALLSKSSIIMLPVVLLGTAWWRFGKIDRQDIVRTIPFFVLSAVFAAVTIWFQFHRSLGEKSADPLDLVGKTIAASGAVWFYLWKTIWPVNLAMIYPQWEITKALSAWLPAVGLLGVIGCCWHFRNSWGRAALFALGYFIVMLFPVLGFFDMYFLTYARVADHWQYAALIGISTLIVSGVVHLIEKRFRSPGRPTALFGAAVALLLGVITWNRAQVFATSEGVWKDALQKNPNCWAAHSNLAVAYDTQGRIDDAIVEYEKTIQLYPAFAKSHYGYAVALEKKGRTTEAAAEYREALRLQPDHIYSLNKLGNFLALEGKRDEALTLFQKAITVNPDFAEAQNNLANLLAMENKTDEAIAHYEQALLSQPDFPEAHNNLGIALQKRSDMTNALFHFQRAMTFRPDYVDARLNLATLLLSTGKLDEAQAAFETVLQLNPAIPAVHYNLGLIYGERGDRAKAAEHFSEALRLNPNFVEAKRELEALTRP